MIKDQLIRVLKVIESEAVYLLNLKSPDNKDFLNFNKLLLELLKYEVVNDNFVQEKIREIKAFKISNESKTLSKIETLFNERFGRISNNKFYSKYGSLNKKQKYILGILEIVKAINYHLHLGVNKK